MRSRLLWKLLGVNLLVLGVVVLAVWAAVDYLAAGYFSELMREYGISTEASNRMFLGAVHRYLVGATVSAVLLAAFTSLVLTRRILGPLGQMTQVAGRVAAGDFSMRVTAATQDEVGALGAVFNRMAESLERLERLRKSMVADVAHELRTPLTNVRGYLEALHDGVIPADPSTFAMLLAEVERLGSLVENLLQLARADAARTSLEKTPLSLGALIGEVGEITRPDFEARGVRLDVRVAPEADAVTADRGRIFQVLRNLLDNALRFTGAGGAVAVAAEPLPGGVRVEVSNPGQEIPEQDLPRIFERFFVVDRSRSRDGCGAGLGLAIVKELVEAHGGTVGASSGYGRTTVWFILPRRQGVAGAP